MLSPRKLHIISYIEASKPSVPQQNEKNFITRFKLDATELFRLVTKERPPFSRSLKQQKIASAVRSTAIVLDDGEHDAVTYRYKLPQQHECRLLCRFRALLFGNSHSFVQIALKHYKRLNRWSFSKDLCETQRETLR